MSILEDKAALERAIGDTLAHENAEAERVLQRWPAELRWIRQEGASVLGILPHMFAEAFPAAPREGVNQLCLAGMFLSGALLECDMVADTERAPYPDVTERLLRMQILQFEGLRVLSGTFGADHPFWADYQAVYAEYAAALLEEKTFARGERPLSAFDRDVAVRLGVGKSALARAALAALAHLSQDPRHLAALDLSMCDYMVARQCLDDVQDWKDDVRLHNPSLLLARVFDVWPSGETTRDELVELARDVHYGGHSLHVLELGRDYARRAEETARPADVWRRMVRRLGDAIEQAHADVSTIVAENRARTSRHAPTLAAATTAGLDAGADPLGRALRYLARQWRLGFGEARHLMIFDVYGDSAERCHRGDVFQRALIVDALQAAQSRVPFDLSAIVHDELDYIITKRRTTGVGGWSYFPELVDLPADADDLGQVILALHAAGRTADLDAYCAPPLRTLLTECMHDTGTFETWIVPRTPATADEHLQARAIAEAWGTGPDAEVIANLLYAVARWQPDALAPTLARALDWMEAAQAADGSWRSSWYHGPFYGTYVCVRLLVALRPRSPALARAARFVAASQSAGGSWGDPLATAFALLAHRYLDDAGVACGADTGAALVELAATQSEDGSWPSVDLVKMEIGRAKGHIVHVASYGSRTITTALVLKALALR